MSYDPHARRETPLARLLSEKIARSGPMPLKEFMAACLQDDEHGYYRSRQAIGREGDFVTAPEISQVFGELVGLWSAVVWQQMGSPDRVHLVELGPGRGTLMRDALRACRLVKPFAEAVCVHLIESSETLQRIQEETLEPSGFDPSWHRSLASVPLAPTIVIANEFLDALAVDQLVATEAGWRLRAVTVDTDGRLQFGEMIPPAGDDLNVPDFAANAKAGSIVTVSDFGGLVSDLAMRGKAQPLAALFLDYGHTERALGDTLQAVRAHRYEHPLTSPGEADLTTHVDFADFRAQISAHAELTTDGPVAQAEFLGSLGIMERASKLMSANPAKAGQIEAAVARLMAPQGMGTRFKVLGVRSTGLPPLPGLGG